MMAAFRIEKNNPNIHTPPTNDPGQQISSEETEQSWTQDFPISNYVTELQN